MAKTEVLGIRCRPEVREKFEALKRKKKMSSGDLLEFLIEFDLRRSSSGDVAVEV